MPNSDHTTDKHDAPERDNCIIYFHILYNQFIDWLLTNLFRWLPVCKPHTAGVYSSIQSPRSSAGKNVVLTIE